MLRRLEFPTFQLKKCCTMHLWRLRQAATQQEDVVFNSRLGPFGSVYTKGGFRTFSARANSTLPDHGSGHSAGSRRGTPGDLQGCQLAKVRCGCSFVLQQGGKGQTKKNHAVLRLVSFLSHLRRINGSGLSGDGHRVIDRRAVWAKKGL